MDSKHIKQWLTLLLIPKLGLRQYRLLIERLEHPLRVLTLSAKQQAEFGLTVEQVRFLSKPDERRIEAIIAIMERLAIRLIPIDNAFYPDLLKQIYDPPLALFCQGHIECLQSLQMAVVGSRMPSHYGKQVTVKLTAELVEAGLTITSGLAKGVDGLAHQTALNHSGKTIAVLGAGHQSIYPRQHASLAERIKDRGVVVSEFLPDEPPIHYHFPRRNRIIAGLSVATLVTEANAKSGSLITAQLALDQNREVYAVPGNIFNPLSNGPNQLIQQGAHLLTDIADIAISLNENIKHHKTDKKYLACSGLLASVDHDPTPIDVIIQRSNLPVDQVLAELLIMELEGKIVTVPGGYARVVNK